MFLHQRRDSNSSTSMDLRLTAQALEYASWVKDLDAEQIQDIAVKHLKGESLETAFQLKFCDEIPEVINEHHSIVIVASEIDLLRQTRCPFNHLLGCREGTL
jgi:hypothetical protein